MKESRSTLAQLLESTAGYRRTETLFTSVAIPEALFAPQGETVPRAVLAMAMDLLLFEDLLRRVPQAQAYVLDRVAAGRKVVYDHGALRTVKTAANPLPTGHLAFARILEPLGYQVNGVYPLDRLAMKASLNSS
jgi:hypothetical protein